MKTKTIFSCQNCGAQSPRWLGKCPACESWNSYVEEIESAAPDELKREGFFQEDPVLLHTVEVGEQQRVETGISEFDRVLGGGIVRGSVILIGGDPGIGKSTLTLQAMAELSKKGRRVLYVSGEESIQQTKVRADRLGAGREANLFIVNQIDLNAIRECIRKVEPDVVVVDSIQVIFNPEMSSSPGTVSQVRECAAILTQMAKANGWALFLIGHVTKEGMIAGPRVLEHIVDTVLYFEGDRYVSHRVIRTIKNRFGSTNELGVFEMTASGLAQVANPSEIFLCERPRSEPGSVVVPILEGTRPFLVEVQGLVSRSSFGMVRQKAQGFDANRLAMLVAVLEKRLGLNLQDKDIFLNVVGGVKIMDPAADLGVAMAIASAFYDKPVPQDTVILGEVGLSSEIRSVTQVAVRLCEAQKLGFQSALIPKNNMLKGAEFNHLKLNLVPVAALREAMEYFKS